MAEAVEVISQAVAMAADREGESQSKMCWHTWKRVKKPHQRQNLKPKRPDLAAHQPPLHSQKKKPRE